MGQRLNLEITMKGNVLANAYYHWSGYTSSSLNILESALQKFKDGSRTESDWYELALDMLENTGAKFTDDELHAWNYHSFTDILGRILPKRERNSDEVNRNDGLISVTSMGINNTREWEEARVQIDIKDHIILFNAVWPLKDWKKELIEYYEVDPSNVPEIPFDFNQIAFSEFDDFKREITSLIEKEVYQVKHCGKYYSFIE